MLWNSDSPGPRIGHFRLLRSSAPIDVHRFAQHRPSPPWDSSAVLPGRWHGVGVGTGGCFLGCLKNQRWLDFPAALDDFHWFSLMFQNSNLHLQWFTGATSPRDTWILWWLPRAQGHRGQDCQCWAAAYEQSAHRCSDCTQFIRWKGVSHHGPLE
jgi:hypothetical protein